MAEGVVKWFNDKKGYGFIARDEGKDLFVHHTSIEMTGFRTLSEGDRGAVREDFAFGTRDGCPEAWNGGPGRYEGACQCQQAQRAVLRACVQDRGSQAKIEARARERYEREKAEHEARLAAREAREKATGKKPGGKPPAAPVEGPLPSDQVNLTDEASRIMPVAGGGFEQCDNAQAVVAEDSPLVVAGDVVQAPNDKQQLEPMLTRTGALPEELSETRTMLADNGYFSEASRMHLIRVGILLCFLLCAGHPSGAFAHLAVGPGVPCR